LGLARAPNSHNNVIISPGLSIITALHRLHMCMHTCTFAFDSAIVNPTPRLQTMHPTRIRSYVHMVGGEWRRFFSSLLVQHRHHRCPPSTDFRFHNTLWSICSCVFSLRAPTEVEPPRKKEIHAMAKQGGCSIIISFFLYILYISKLRFSFLRVLAALLLLSFCRSVALSLCNY